MHEYIAIDIMPKYELKGGLKINNFLKFVTE